MVFLLVSQIQYVGFHSDMVLDFINRQARADMSEAVSGQQSVQRHIVSHRPMKHVQVCCVPLLKRDCVGHLWWGFSRACMIFRLM